LADAWLAANLALAAPFTPLAAAPAAPLPGGASAGSTTPDAAAAGGQPGAPATVPASVSRQVTIQLLKQTGDVAASGGRLTLRLDPPQLGRVEVSFEQRGDRLFVTLTAETPAAERALRSGVGELQQALTGPGGKWQDAQVKIESAPGRDESRPDGEENGDQGEDPSRRRRERADD
ncbi:MAG: flagellar hook-length control protein FliK, partial [Candidatus Krumholzibacteriia bacterium]